MMKEILDRLGEQQKATLATRVHFETEKAIQKLEQERRMAMIKDINLIDAEIGICNSLYNWFQEIIRGKDVVDS